MDFFAGVGQARPLTLEQLSGMMHHMFDDNKHLHIRMAQLESELRDSKEEQARLGAQNGTLKSEIAGLKAEHGVWILDLQRENNKLRLDVESLRAGQQGLEDQLDLLERGIGKTDEDVMRLSLRSHGPATAAVMNTYELWEKILGDLNAEDLFKMWHMDKNSRAVVESSTEVRESMFFSSPGSSFMDLDNLRYNPWLNTRKSCDCDAETCHAGTWVSIDSWPPLDDNDEAFSTTGYFSLSLDHLDAHDATKCMDHLMPNLDCKLANTYYTSPTPMVNKVEVNFAVSAWKKCPFGGTLRFPAHVQGEAEVGRATYRQLCNVARLLFLEKTWSGGEWQSKDVENIYEMEWDMPGKLLTDDEDMGEAAGLIVGEAGYKAYVWPEDEECHCDCGKCDPHESLYWLPDTE